MARSRNQALFPAYRPRRMRAKPAMRDMIRENILSPTDFILPIFVMDGFDEAHPITSMPGVSRHTVDRLPALANSARSLGIPTVCIFPCIGQALKTQDCVEAWNPENLSNRAIRAIKEAVPDIMVMTDIALDPYNINGHDGIVVNNEILNDETVEALVKMGESQAQVGADILGPSDMMDGRITKLRSMLEKKGFHNVSILSYSAKYASSFYSPFRDAVNNNTVLVGDKNTYQMDPANSDEAMRMIARDLSEGADMVMVKPGMPYLDICQRAKIEFQVPTFAYQVSGEYAMLKAAAQNEWLNGELAMLESLMAFKRAGCDGVLTYFALEASKLLLR